jgi:DnaJ-class molecular chaperone
MKRSTIIRKAIVNLGLNGIVGLCSSCNGRGKWVFFHDTGVCPTCVGSGIIGGNKEHHDQVNKYIDSGDFDMDEMLKHSNVKVAS